MSPYILAVTGYIFGFFSLLASMIIVVVYYLIFVLFEKTVLKKGEKYYGKSN
jgi:hypothetical protein